MAELMRRTQTVVEVTEACDVALPLLVGRNTVSKLKCSDPACELLATCKPLSLVAEHSVVTEHSVDAEEERALCGGELRVQEQAARSNSFPVQRPHSVQCALLKQSSRSVVGDTIVWKEGWGQGCCEG